MLQELTPLSKDLAALGAAGLEALDYLSSGRKPDPSWAATERAQLDTWKKPRAELLLMIAPQVERLVDAAIR